MGTHPFGPSSMIQQQSKLLIVLCCLRNGLRSRIQKPLARLKCNNVKMEIYHFYSRFFCLSIAPRKVNWDYKPFLPAIGKKMKVGFCLFFLFLHPIGKNMNVGFSLFLFLHAIGKNMNVGFWFFFFFFLLAIGKRMNVGFCFFFFFFFLPTIDNVGCATLDSLCCLLIF